MRCHEIISERGKRARRSVCSEQRRRVTEQWRAKAIRGRQEETSWPSRSAVALRQSERMARGVRWSVLPGLLALTALIGPFAAALTRNDLYQYTGPGSHVLETDLNGMLMSAEAVLKTPIVFYDKIYNSIFVSTGIDRAYSLDEISSARCSMFVSLDYYTLTEIRISEAII